MADDLSWNDNPAWQRYRLAAVTVLLPYVVLFGIYWPSVQMFGEPNWDALYGIEIAKEPVARFASTMSGLFGFGIANGFLRITAVASVVLATALLKSLLGWRWTLQILAVIGVVALAVFVCTLLTAANAGYIRAVLEIAGELAGGSRIGLGASAASIKLAIAINLFSLTAGYNSLLVAFAALAVRADAAELTADRLQARLHSLIWLTVMAALLLVCITAVNKALAVWPQGLMTEPSQKAFGSAGTAIANYWGAFGTIAVLCAFVPPLISLRADIERAAPREDIKTQVEWKKANGLEFDFKSTVGTVITTAAPLLTGPGIDLIGKLLS